MHRLMFSRPILNIRNCRPIKSESTLPHMTRDLRYKALTLPWFSSKTMARVRVDIFQAQAHYTTKFPIEKVWTKEERMALDMAAENEESYT